MEHFFLVFVFVHVFLAPLAAPSPLLRRSIAASAQPFGGSLEVALVREGRGSRAGLEVAGRIVRGG